MVAFPARILRCLDPDLLPDLIAADIHQLKPAEKAWRGWSLRYVPADQRQALAAQTAALGRHRAQLLDRLDALQAFENIMLTAVAGGSLDLTTHDPMRHSEGRL